MSESENTIWSYEYEKDKAIQPGSLLLSEPFMPDENFRRTVILVCRHHSVEGTSGVILNKPVQLSLDDLLDNFPKDFGGRLYLGGPVGTDMIQMVHTMGHKITDSTKLAEGLWWGGNFDQLKKLIRQGEITSNHVRFYIGYSGWEAQQLRDEIRDNSWIIAQARHEYVFDSDPDQLWRKIMNGMGGIYQTMAGYPENPNLN
ncbi:MAG: YqgE/AlgH family protein [Bacteroidetes bacterium]|nr:YqgE/AlgH family protein [Bacteroidota bacterium]